MKKRIYQGFIWVILLGLCEPVSVLALETSSSMQITNSEQQTDAATSEPSTQEQALSDQTEVQPSTSAEQELQAITEGIILSDDQFLVADTTIDPYRKIVYLESFFDSGPLKGTGVMIAPNLVLTAAHNIYSVELGQWSQEVVVTPAQNDGAAPYGVYQGSRVFMFKAYQNEASDAVDSYDLAVVQLSESVDSQVGFLPVSGQLSEGNRIQIAGYPATTQSKIGFMYAMWGDITSFNGTLINYKIDTESGQSGSPVLNEKNEIVGIHTKGFVGENGDYIYNAARRINQDSLNLIAFAKGELETNEAVMSQWLGQMAVFRLYHPGVKRHLYTQDQHEISVLKDRGWNYEGETFKGTSYGVPVYRLYSPDTKEHLYTTSSHERAILITRGWKDEDIAWYAQGERPVYRLYHSGLKVHLYTSDMNERNVLIQRGWNDESIAWYAL